MCGWATNRGLGAGLNAKTPCDVLGYTQFISGGRFIESQPVITQPPPYPQSWGGVARFPPRIEGKGAV
jgi:hypothetical protein